MPSFWIQHGYGKGDKLQRLHSAGLLEGVVLSPADEEPAGLQATVGSVAPARAVLDPQSYVYSIPDGRARCHAAHGLELRQLTWGMAAGEVEAISRAVIAANDTLGLESIVAPTCIQRSFSDVWTSLALQMARTTIDLVGDERPVYLSAVFEESALDSWQDVERWLDVVTRLEVRGFYIVVARRARSPYPAPWVATRLVNLSRLVFSLSELNGFEVLVGYGDVEGVLAIAAGAAGSGSGWFYSQRAFSEDKWQPSEGGRQANPRVYASGLMTPILAVGEGDAVASSTIAAEVIPSDQLRTLLSQNAQGWSLTDSRNQHLEEVATLTNEIGAESDIAQRLDHLDGRIGMALGRLSALDALGIPIATAYRPRIAALRDGLLGFRAAEGL